MQHEPFLARGKHRGHDARSAVCRAHVSASQQILVTVPPMLLAFLWSCTGTDKSPDYTSDGNDDYHPSGYADAAVHGIEAKCQEDTCLDCHGEDLTGGTSNVSCDSCHIAGWRTDCIFCHGGTETSTGAPPMDIDGETARITFPEHTSHVTEGVHAAWDCTQCHVKPTDVLSVSHFLTGDETACAAEVVFLDGLSPAASYSTTGSCSNLYCHGNGQSSTSTATAQSGSEYGCDGCHGGEENSWRGLSGKHPSHRGHVTCGDCHKDTVSGTDTIIGPDYHVNGTKDVRLPESMTRNNNTCNGTCHDESHNNRTW